MSQRVLKVHSPKPPKPPKGAAGFGGAAALPSGSPHCSAVLLSAAAPPLLKLSHGSLKPPRAADAAVDGAAEAGGHVSEGTRGGPPNQPKAVEPAHARAERLAASSE